MTLRITLSSLVKRETRGTTKCLDKGNHNPPTAIYEAIICYTTIGVISLYRNLNRLTAVDAYMRKSEGPSQNKS